MRTEPSSASADILALAGPTASGKTAAALALATLYPVEIISVDSALVYRGMDIGTAKPTAQELASVPHHLIDIRDPADSYSAAEFARDATTLIAQIQARGKLPLLVGGTMLYFKALFDGLDDMPAADAATRLAIDSEARQLGWAAMHAELARVDPLTAQRLHAADAQRIQRALEVYRLSGKPLSAFHSNKDRRTANLATRTTLISLEPLDRAWLHARIEQRFDAMLAAHFLDEVRHLMHRPDLHADLPSMRCVGYRQAWEALSGKSPLSELRERGIYATRQLAKRQLTWLRRMPQRRVIHCDAPDALDQVRALAANVLQQR